MPLWAQVGHPPDASPYRFIEARRVISATSGYLWGDLGDAGVGPSNGPVAGLRFDLLFNGPASVSFNAAWAGLERRIIDPTRPQAERTVGSADMSIFMFDAGFNLIFTGGKTWRGLAPYAGIALGAAFGNDVPTDTTSGFRFSTKFLLTPQAGLRLHVSDRLSLDARARDVMWRLSYPQSYFLGGDPVLDPLTQKRNEWTHHLALTLSLGWAIGVR
jgi:hypothetical protein